MPLAETRNAIGVLTRLLAQQLAARTDATTVDVGRPEQSAQFGDAGPKLNIFLYSFQHDSHLRNTPLDRGQDAPIWLSLKFLLTAIDGERDSDSSAALDLLGQGMLALRDIGSQSPTELALLDNPEQIKISFDNSDVELLSAVMQGTDERYRLSSAFEVRPIMLTEVAGSGGAPLILSIGEVANPGILVLPSLGPRLDTVEPAAFELGDTITLAGGDLSADTVEVCFGDTCIIAPPADVTNRQVTVTVPGGLSAGSHAMTVRRTLPNGRLQSSNAALGRLRPTLQTATPGPLTASGANLFGSLDLTGERLGDGEDSVFVGFYRDGAVQLLLEVAGSAAQTGLTVSVDEPDALPSGSYRVLLRVNGEQALNAPLVNWS